MGFHGFILLLFLLSGTLYNAANTAMRLVIVSIWCATPLVGLVFLGWKRVTFRKADLQLQLIGLFLLSLTIVSLMVNSSTFQVEFNGAAVEKLTPLLFFVPMISIHYFRNVNVNCSARIIQYYFWIIVLVLLVDLVYRYISAPAAFMNYSNRQAAKTVGFFSTTNVHGQFITFLLIVLSLIRIRYKYVIGVIFFLVLITTMARSAGVALVLVWWVAALSRLDLTLKFMVAICCVFAFLGFFVVDPFHLLVDGSFLSKISFIETTWSIFRNSQAVDIIFGYGASYNSIVDVLGVEGWSPHIPFLKAYLYYGVIGLIFYLYSLTYFLVYEKKLFLPILSYFIFGLAGAPIFWPTLIVGLFLVALSVGNKDYLPSYSGVNQ